MHSASLSEAFFPGVLLDAVVLLVGELEPPHAASAVAVASMAAVTLLCEAWPQFYAETGYITGTALVTFT